jgi:signal peptide peptidase SppA
MLLDVLSAPWAILPEKLVEITEICSAHMRGDNVDIEAVEAKLGRSLQNERQGYDVHAGGVAVIPITGVIAKRMNLFSRISGGASTQLIQRDVKAALNDDTVHSIVLSIDSPGGTVDGTEETADLIASSRDIKPIVAHGDGQMTSGGYWLGAAASRVFLNGATSVTGSIGVVTQHFDRSELDKKIGVKFTDITAGKYKRIAGEHAPLSAEGRAVIQSHLDQIYSVFVDAVARNRGTTPEDVLARMADGKIFIGEQARTAGLIDGFSTISQLVATLNGERRARARAFLGGGLN